MLQVTINSQPYSCTEGSILQALRHLQIDIPAVCFDSRLAAYGGCRLCMVGIEGDPRLKAACVTPLSAGMVIETHTQEIEAERRTLLSMLASSVPADGLQRHAEHEFYRYIKHYGLEDALKGRNDAALVDDSHPYIHVDMAQCIYCYRCVRICNEVQGQFVWQVWNRGDKTRIRPDSGTTLLESSCVSCGACADTCPTGALEDKSVLKFGRPLETARTTCSYCGVGCEMNVGTRAGRIVQITPALDAPVNKGHLCVKGRYAFDFNHAEDRILDPMIREPAGWKRVSWETAINAAAGGLREILSKGGPQSMGVLGSARATNEDNYVAQKFARVVLGTNNVDCCARVCHAPSAAALKLALGTGAATNSFDDIEQASAFLIFGSNTTENHPVVGARIRQMVLGGSKLIVIDPRKTELANLAHVHLQIRLGTNVALLNSLAHVVINEHLQDQAFISARVDGWNAFAQHIHEFTPERAAAICGVTPDAIRDAARIYATSHPAMSFHGLGLTEHVQGTDGVLSLINLALLTGNIGKPGAGVNPLRGQNNVQGAAHMGCEPGNLTGMIPISQGKELVESVWRFRLPEAKGLNLMEMMDAAGEGKFKAVWAMGYDFYLTNPDANRTLRALRSMEMVIIQDMFMTETAREVGTIFFPACSGFEKDGSYMNGERRVQRVRQVLPPPGQSKPDWEIVSLVARKMGFAPAFAFRSAEEIWNEVRQIWKAGAGISYAKLESGGIRWPCPSEDHPGTQLMHVEKFAHGNKAALRPISLKDPKEIASLEYPFLLSTGRTLYQFNAGTMTLRTPNIVFRPTDLLDMAPSDGERLGIREGESVQVCSRYGTAEITVRLNSAQRPGELFASFTMPDIFVNRVMSSWRDPVTMTPEYKITAVQINRLAPIRQP